MAGSSFGTIFKITTWGESHGNGIGVVIRCQREEIFEKMHRL